MKTIYAVIGATTVTAVAFLIGVGCGAIGLAQLGAVRDDVPIGESINKTAKALEEAKEKEHGPLS